MKNVNIDGYKRITKKEAARRYNAGEIVRICPVNVSPVNIWGMFSDAVNNHTAPICTDFETVVNAFTYYNCNSETGKYPAYYVRG